MIKDKVIAITGASSGIGEATALLLASQGAKVILGARRTERLARVAEKTGGLYMPLDVRKKENLADFVQLALDNYGRLDVLINNAGIGPISPLDELRVTDWDDMIDINFKGVLYGIAAALPVFRKQNSGHFVNTISTAGLQIVPTMAVCHQKCGTHGSRCPPAGSRPYYQGNQCVPGIYQDELFGFYDQPGNQGTDESACRTDCHFSGCYCPCYCICHRPACRGGCE
mgnify:CR=1 FL=1